MNAPCNYPNPDTPNTDGIILGESDRIGRTGNRGARHVVAIQLKSCWAMRYVLTFHPTVMEGEEKKKNKAA